jgi:hypothetical protein
MLLRDRSPDQFVLSESLLSEEAEQKMLAHLFRKIDEIQEKQGFICFEDIAAMVEVTEEELKERLDDFDS